MFEKHGTGDEPTSSHRIGEPDGGTRASLNVMILGWDLSQCMQCRSGGVGDAGTRADGWGGRSGRFQESGERRLRLGRECDGLGTGQGVARA